MELAEVRPSPPDGAALRPGRRRPGRGAGQVLDAGLRVPSAGFTQAVSLLVLDGPAEARLLGSDHRRRRAADRWLTGLSTAPVLVLVWTDRAAYLDRYAEPDKGWTDRDPARWTAPYWYVDAGMAAMAMLLAAVDEGLGACFFGAPPDRIPAIRSTFGVPVGHELVGVVSLGFPAGSPRRSRRDRRAGRRTHPPRSLGE